MLFWCQERKMGALCSEGPPQPHCCFPVPAHPGASRHTQLWQGHSCGRDDMRRGGASTSHPGSASGTGYAGQNNPRLLPELVCSWPPPRTRAGGGQRFFFFSALKAWEHLDEALG